jgi:thiamine kinase-like enzyme
MEKRDEFSLNNNDLSTVIQQENLGSVKKSHRLTGGRLHQVWYLNTTKGEYVAKLLNPSKISSMGCAKYAQFELIARSFKSKGINAVPALNEEPQRLPGDQKYYLLYNYQPGTVITGSQLNVSRASKLGCLLGKMHQANLSSEIEVEIKPHKYDVKMNKWGETLEKNGIASSSEVKALLPQLEDVDQKCREACNHHQTSKAVISHGDMDLANIIWDEKDDPWLIDWEYAGKFDALYDLINSALYASETSAGTFNVNMFEAVISSYAEQLKLPAKCSPETSSEAIHLALAGWMRWIDYNCSRLESSKDPEERALAIQQIEKWTKTVLGVYNNHDNFLRVINKVNQKQEINTMIVNGFWTNRNPVTPPVEMKPTIPAPNFT